jgi:transposase
VIEPRTGTKILLAAGVTDMLRGFDGLSAKVQKFACSGCERVVEAPASSRPIEHGLAGPGLLAHVLV